MARIAPRLICGTVMAVAAWSLAPAPAGADPECRCRYAERYYLLDDCVCMPTAAGVQRACCTKVLNNTSWAFSARGCEIVRRRPPGPETAAGRGGRDVAAVTRRPHLR